MRGVWEALRRNILLTLLVCLVLLQAATLVAILTRPEPQQCTPLIPCDVDISNVDAVASAIARALSR